MAITTDLIQLLIGDRRVRIEATRRDLSLFFSFYFTKYIKYEIAPFQNEILRLLQDEKNRQIVITAFRNSAKSTFCSLVLPIWSVIGIHKKKNILLVSQTDPKAEQLLIDIRRMLVSQRLLLDDHGTFYSSNDEWNKRTLVIPKYGARITAVSIGESIRGMRHEESRPDLIIYDDIEDVQSAKTQEGRDKLWEIVTREFMPLGTKDTRHIFIGNLVHPDSTMVRLRELIQSGRMSGIYREYPLIKDDVILWPGQFPNMDAIEEFKKSLPSEIDFLREYMLQIIPEGSRLVFPKDIQRYEENDLRSRSDFQMYLILIDPAVSGERTSKHDKTSIIVVRVYGSGETMKMYISPNPINDWLEWPQIIEKVQNIVASFGESATYQILVEGGSTQRGLTQMLLYKGLNAQEVTPQGNDKRTRLSMTVPWLANKIVFSKLGLEELEHQLYYFGAERYDDLVDALTLIPLAMPEIEKHFSAGVYVLNNPFYDYVDHLMGNNKNDDDDWGESGSNTFPRIGRPSSWRNIIPG